MRRARKNTISKFSHVIVQGIEKEYIFKKKIYKEKYLKLIKENLQNFNLKLLAYAIMDNHTHMCIYHENTEDLSKFMHLINSKFANYYNYLENRVGYLFRNRFYSQEIKDKQQLLNVIAYIHNNPLKAKMIKKLDEYKYSSYKDYVQNNISPEIILLIFNTLEYKKIFNFIHRNYTGIDVKDIKEEKNRECLDVINEFLNENKISLNLMKKEENLLLNLVKNIRLETNATNKEISNILCIDKNKLTKMNRKIIEESKKSLMYYK